MKTQIASSLNEILKNLNSPLRHGLGSALAGLLIGSGWAAAPGAVVISQVYGGGGNSGAPFKHDFIELHNISHSAVSIDGWSVQYSTATGSAWSSKTDLSGVIPAGGYFLIAEAAGSSESAALPTADLSGSIAISAAAGKVALVNSKTFLSGEAPHLGTSVVDFVGFGAAANAFEGSFAPAASNQSSIARQDFGSSDSGDNSVDFVVTTPPTPRNSSSSAYVPVGALPDTDPPRVVALVPADLAAGVALDSSLTIKFDEPVIAGGGGLTLYDSNGVVEDFQTSGMINGNLASFTPRNLLKENSTYYLLVSASAFRDVAGNPFGGIVDSADWSFSTTGPDLTGPVPVQFFPGNGAVAVPLRPAVLRITFDEIIQPVPGTSLLLKRANGSIVEEVASDHWSVDVDSKVAVIPIGTLESAVGYYLEVPAGAFQDSLGNRSLAFGGPTGEMAWTFTAIAPPLAALLHAGAPYHQSFGELVAPVPLPLGWAVVSSNPTAVTAFPNDANQKDWGAGTGAGLRGNGNVLGFQHSGVTEVVEKILTLENRTGSAITQLTISYVGRAERIGEGRSPAYTVSLREDWSSSEAGSAIPALAYSTAGGDGASRNSTVAGINIAPNALFQLVWTSERGAGSGFSKQIGISEVAVLAGPATFPPALAGPTVVAATLSSMDVVVTAEVISDGGLPVTDRGFVYGRSSELEALAIGGAGVVQLANDVAALGVFSQSISGLDPATIYRLRAYATNAAGTTYSPARNFETQATPPSFAGNYSEAFNGFAGEFAPGWTGVSAEGVENFIGNWTSGSSAGGFYGSTHSPGVVGYSHTAGTGPLTLKLTLINHSGRAINELFVSYLARVETLANTRLPSWTVFIDDVEVPALAYSTGAGIDQRIASTLSGLNIPDGASFSISWVSSRGAGDGSSRRIGLGDVLVAAEAPEQGTYSAWIRPFNVGLESGVHDDFDHDGIPNGVENHLGTDPAKYDRGLVVVSRTDDTLIFNHPISATPAGDLVAVYEWSMDLESWTSAGGTFRGTKVAIVRAVERGTAAVTATVSGSRAPQMFVRLKVMQE